MQFRVSALVRWRDGTLACRNEQRWRDARVTPGEVSAK